MLQKRLAFALPSLPASQAMDASDWRACFVSLGIGDYREWNALRVGCPPGKLGISPATPAAGEWLAQHVEAIAAAVADRAGVAVPFEILERRARVSVHPDKVFAYQLPRLVVAKGGGDWAGLREAEPEPALLGRVIASIEAALRREWLAWSCLPPALASDERSFLVVSDPGRVTIIPAVHADRSGHGKPVNALVRRHLTVLTPLRIEGDFCAGPLATLGYSRMAPARAPEVLNRDVQRALLALPPFQEETAC